MSLELPILTWTHDPGLAEVTADSLTLTSLGGVDWSNDSLGSGGQLDATSFGFVVEPGDLRLSARVSVTSERSTFDAGALTLWADENHWAKICFESSPQGETMVVSVVTNDFSDDVNSFLVDDTVYLRVSRVGPAWAFHASPDGVEWRFVRLFRLATDAPVHLGFMSQAPLGGPCVAVFDEIDYRRDAPADLRSGE